MAVARMHRYSVDTVDLPQLIARRADLIAGIQAVHPGLVETHLIQLADGTFVDIWRWESLEQMAAAAPAASSTAARAVMELTRDATAINGEIIDGWTSR